MIANKSVLAIVPARGGSKGLPGKNIKNLCGKPMIAWTIEAARRSEYIDRIILSSEDQDIINTAQKWGCDVPFVRPDELAQDDTPGIDPVLHALESLPEVYDFVVLLQPTSPFRSHQDIDRCIEISSMNDCSCVSIVEVSESPYWMYIKDNKHKITPLIETDRTKYQRQVLPKVFILNGAVYVGKVASVRSEKTFVTENTLGYEMPISRSLDIDDQTEFEYAEFLFNRKLRSPNDLI